MIEPIANSVAHQRALRRIEKLWDAKPGSKEERELDALATLVDAYERRTFPLELLSPIEAIKTRCEQLGWSRKELEPLIGSRARVSEVLTGKRPLTLPMIRNIHRAMGIPSDILISEAQPAERRKPRREPGPSVARVTSRRATRNDRTRARSRAR